MKILAVDDDPIILELLTQFVEALGDHEITTAESGAEALSLLEGTAARRFDCFMLDIQMPVMDGIELARSIRDIKGYADAPILMLTAMSEKSYVDRAFSAGATDYLTKPFDPTEVAVRLGLARQLVAERKMLSDNAEIIDSFIEVLEETTRHDLVDAIDLGKMNGLLSYPAFENYLYQSGRSVLFLATVFAVKIRNVKNWHHKLPPLEFKELLRQSAREIIARLEDHEVFLTYRGDGEFVGVVPRSGSQALRAIGETIEIEVNESEGKFGAYLPRSLKLVVGAPVANRLPTRGGILKNIWSALEKVREKADPESAPFAGAPAARGSDNPYTGPGESSDTSQNSLKAEFQELLEDQLRNEVGEHRSKQTSSERAEVSLFRFKKHRAPLARAKEKHLFGRTDTQPGPAQDHGTTSTDRDDPSNDSKLNKAEI